MGLRRCRCQPVYKPPAQSYEDSVANGSSQSSIGFTAVQGLCPTEDATADLDDLSEILSHGVTLTGLLSRA
jgi:hypothetical protein